MSDRSLMIELWTECNNLCKFCYLGERNRTTSIEDKLKNMKDAKKIIEDTFDTTTERYKAVGFIGGEFFQGQLNTQEVRNNFYDICKTVFDLIEEDKVEDFWCYCTLTIGDQKDLYDLVDLFDKTVTDKEKHKFWVLVSYDTWGRFYIPGRKENWEKHMLNLQQYPFIRFNVTSILSQDFCEKVISGEHNLIEFRKKFKIDSFFFKQPTKTSDYDTKEEFAEKYPQWFVKRMTFIRFLEKLKKDDPVLFEHVLNIIQRADDIMHSDDGYTGQHRDKLTWEETGMEVLPKCGHVTPYQCYADSDACCLCDYFKVKEGV